jgi:penicillin-binding protein 1C
MKRSLGFAGAGIAVVLLLFFILNVIFPLNVNVPYSTVVLSREGNLLQGFLAKDEKWRMKCSVKEIPPELAKAFIYKEDRYFYYHPGVNPFAMVRAAFNNIVYRKRTSGASTITMQVIRLLHPRNRTVVSKVIETFRALQLELQYSKNEILALYFDLVPYGGNIEGVQAASWIYFGRQALLLSDAQIAALVVIPNKPTSLKPGQNSGLIMKQRNKWLHRFNNEKLISDEQLKDALEEPLNMKRHLLPSSAPHLCMMLHKKSPDDPVIRTTIASSMQNQVELITFNHSERMKLRNINNAAVLVIDNNTHEIRAYAGNSDFNDQQHSGQVNGVTAVRSPGSTLKPLVYALAIDKGIITPKTVLNDVPVNFAGYSPENFNKDYNGQVTAEKALAYSLNIPAVEVLNETGVKEFCTALKECGFSAIAHHEKDLGLSVVLGGCGVTLQELAGLFSCFANEGIYIPVSCVPSLGKDTIRIASRSAVYMITEILTQLQRPDLPNNASSSYSVPRIAWKTGTSYGRRDAWSIGYNKEYTVAVWCGNFDGTGIPELTGAEMATPLLFEIFNTICSNTSQQWFRPPAELDMRYVCSATGLLPGQWCTDRIIDNYIPTVSSQKKCEHLREVAVDAKEKISYCTSCCPQSGYKKKIYTIYPPEVISYYISTGIPFEHIPEHNPDCQRLLTENTLSVLSPVNNKEYLLEKGVEEKLLLSCASAADASYIYWYVNDRLFKKVNAHEELFFIPSTGLNKITCADDKGRTQTVFITAKYY